MSPELNFKGVLLLFSFMKLIPVNTQLKTSLRIFI